MKENKSKKTLIFWILGAVAVSVAICAVLFFLYRDDYSTYEGRGYKTPEEAALAYANALAKWDYDGMISSCAVESLADNYRIKKLIDRNYTYPTATLNYTVTPASDDDFGRKILIDKILEDIRYRILRQYVCVCGYNSEELFTITGISISEAREFANILELWDDIAKKSKPVAEVKTEVIGSFEPDEKINNTVKACQDSVEKSYEEVWGAGDYSVQMVDLSIDGKEYVLFLDTISYDGKWYVSLVNVSTDYSVDEEWRKVYSSTEGGLISKESIDAGEKR